MSLGAAGQSSSLEQASFVLTGADPTSVQINTWHLNWAPAPYIIPLGFYANEVSYNIYSEERIYTRCKSLLTCECIIFEVLKGFINMNFAFLFMHSTNNLLIV